MNDFEELFCDALDVLQRAHGGALSYVAGGGGTVTFTAIGVSPEALEEIDDGDGGKVRRHVRDVEVYVSDFSAGINDELTFGGVTYVVDSIASDDGIAQVFRMVRLMGSEVGRRGMRK